MRALLVLFFVFSFLAQSAHADVWGHIDDKGVAHFSTERLDPRDEIFFRAGQSFDIQAGGPVGPTPRDVAVPTAPRQLIAFFEVSPSYKRIKHHLREASRSNNIDYELLQALIATESGFDAHAVSPKGAVGLMQIMPATAQRYGVATDKKASVQNKLTDPKINVATGARYLRDLINMFPGQMELALAAYNAGEGAVQRAGNKIPNYKETQNYVKTVMQLYTMLKPPALVAEHRNVPARLRMEMSGGASRRGNMLEPLQAAAAEPNDKIERN
jgi:soluble lytic murein transglycosylase-like protein